VDAMRSKRDSRHPERPEMSRLVFNIAERSETQESDFCMVYIKILQKNGAKSTKLRPSLDYRDPTRNLAFCMVRYPKTESYPGIGRSYCLNNMEYCMANKY
jgi:hypothetical protein